MRAQPSSGVLVVGGGHAGLLLGSALASAGFQIHLPKPVDATQLIDAVAALLRSQTVH